MPPSVASTLQRAQWTPHRRPSRGGPVLPCLWLPLPASPVPAGRAPRRKDGHSGGREEREITDLPYPVVDGAGKAGAHHPRSKQVVSSSSSIGYMHESHWLPTCTYRISAHRVPHAPQGRQSQRRRQHGGLSRRRHRPPRPPRPLASSSRAWRVTAPLLVPCSPWHGITHSAESSKVQGA